ncbi:ectoine synthase [Hoeflea sp. TYP-13]|uniref:ectoine synthase n=1 Tax=Hoeflea sp. TYP-13 TaxID=3230023 RepID=UPI0034C5D37E
MFVRTLDDVIGTERDIAWGNGQSRRLLVEADNMGFALLDTIVNAGTDLEIQYKNHLEAVYCVEGKGSITDLATETKYEIKPGVMYVLDDHDRHRLRATEDLRLICVFNPPLKGNEKHDINTPGSSY